MDLPFGAMPVVAAQVASVGRGLVQVCLLWLGLALQLEHDYSAAHKEHDVRPTRFERELVLENGGVLLGELVDLDDLAHLDLYLRDGIVPCEDL